MVNHDDFARLLSGFQLQAKLLLKSVEQRGGIGIGWRWRKPENWGRTGRGSLKFGGAPGAAGAGHPG
jgi:hypothetical protein